MAGYDDVFNQPIVIDNGSGVLKAGIAGRESPSHEIPACVGEPKHRHVMLNHSHSERFLASEAMEHRGLLRLSYPIRHGVVQNWEHMSTLWDHVYKDCLKSPPEEHPVLLTEAPLNPNRNRSKMAEIFFEQFNVPALYFAPQPVLALYASGRVTGTVLDCGHGVTMAVPIYEGFALPHAITRMDVAGDEVTKYLQHLLRKSGVTFHTSAELETIRLLKEQKCELVQQKSAKFKDDDELNCIKYKLPDGKVLQVGTARFRAPEVLFDPSLLGLEYKGVHHCVLDAIQRADLDLRRALYQSITLAGGSTCFKGFGARMLKELQTEVGKECKIKVYAPVERTRTAWIGGSLLSCMAAFQQMWVRREEHMDSGMAALERKSFY